MGLALLFGLGLSSCRKDAPIATPGGTDVPPQGYPQNTPPILSGVNGNDIAHTLREAYGISFQTDTETSALGAWYHCWGGRECLSDCFFGCSMKMLLPQTAVFQVDFTVSVYGERSRQELARDAVDYLSFCAKTPYDGADPEAAEAWVLANMPDSASMEGERAATISGVTFLLSWAEKGWGLTLYPAGAGGN